MVLFVPYRFKNEVPE
jgi:hypothetical protein